MNSLKGQLLIATPALLDPNFVRTVLLILEHSENGALGVILNRPLEATVADLARQVLQHDLDWDKPIHLGGPVEGPLIVLHTVPELGDQEVLAGVFSTVDAGRIQDLILKRTEPSVIIANYAGWGPGQLESEFETDSWYTRPADADQVFWSREADLWETIVRTINAATLTEMLHLNELPADPSIN